MSEIRLLPPRGTPEHRIALFILAAAPFAFGALALSLGQDANWDLRNYHWYNAYAVLNGRYGFDLLPSQTPWFYNPALDVPFYLFASHVPARLASFALGFVQGFNFILLFMLAYIGLVIKKARWKIVSSTGLAALGMLGGGALALLGTTFYDNVLSLGFFLSALLVIYNYGRLMTASAARVFGLALLFGLPSGLMMGLKLPAVIFAVGFCFGILFMGGSKWRLLLVSFAFGIGVLLGVAIALGPWAWFLQVNFGSPLFPYFNEIFKSPLAPPTSARDEQFLTHNLHDFLLFPFVFADNPYRVGEIAWRDWGIPALYALLPLAFFARFVSGRDDRKQILAVPHATRYLLAAATISYFAWLQMFCIYRYAIPLEMLAPLLIVMAAGLAPLKRQARAAMAVCVLLMVAGSIQPGNWHRRPVWLDRFVEAQIPPLPEERGLMILMAGIDPYSHLIPEFPPTIPFVRIQSNFSSPEQDKGINQIILARVEAHKGPFMLLIPPYDMEKGKMALSYFHLALAAEPCQTVTDRLYDDSSLSLCKLVRRKQT